MLEINIPSGEIYNEKTNEFVWIQGKKITLEHSLVSISKWESKWCKSFISSKEKTNSEMVDYIRCMTLTQNVDPALYKMLSADNLKEVSEYINAPMTATTINNRRQEGQAPSREIITSELIYYWMIEFGIPVQFEKWHINRLMTLISVCNAKQTKSRRMSQRDVMAQNASINAMRRARSGSRG